MNLFVESRASVSTTQIL